MSSDKNSKVVVPSNGKIIKTAIFVILMLSVLVIFLISNLSDKSYKLLDSKIKHRITIARVLDLRYLRLSEAGFILFLGNLEKSIKAELGYTVEFKFVKTVLVDNWLSASSDIFNTQAAKDWLRSQGAVTNATLSSYSWLKSSLDSKSNKQILSSYYNQSDNLIDKIKKDFAGKIILLFKLVPHLKKEKAKISAAYWSYFMANYVNVNFVVTNSPIFLPFNNIPVDAISRGGLVLNLLTKSKNKAGKSYLLSLYPIFRKLRTDKIGLNMASRIALQGFSSYLTGIPFSVDSSSALYPPLGNDFLEWQNRKKRDYSVDIANFRFLSLKKSQ